MGGENSFNRIELLRQRFANNPALLQRFDEFIATGNTNLADFSASLQGDTITPGVRPPAPVNPNPTPTVSFGPRPAQLSPPVTAQSLLPGQINTGNSPLSPQRSNDRINQTPTPRPGILPNSQPQQAINKFPALTQVLSQPGLGKKNLISTTPVSPTSGSQVTNFPAGINPFITNKGFGQ